MEGLRGYPGVKGRIGFTSQQLDEKVASGDWQVHSFPLGFILTEIKQFPEERVLLIHLLGGERLDEWIVGANKRMDEFARECGCNAVEATCRFGLINRMKGLGYKPYRTLMRKDYGKE